MKFKTSNTAPKPEKISLYAIPSTFIVFYWAVCITAIATSIQVIGAGWLVHNIPEVVTVKDVLDYREEYIKGREFTDQDVAELVNRVNFLHRWDQQTVQSSQIFLFFIALFGFSMLLITAVSGQEILR